MWGVNYVAFATSVPHTLCRLMDTITGLDAKVQSVSSLKIMQRSE